MGSNSADAEWKKGSAELLVLSLLEDQPRHGYDISKLIQLRSGGALAISRDLALSAAPPAGEGRLGRWTLGGKARPAQAALLQSDAARDEGAAVETVKLEGFRRRISRVTGIEHA